MYKYFLVAGINHDRTMPEAQTYGRDFMVVVELHRTYACLPVSMNHNLFLITPVIAVVVQCQKGTITVVLVFPVYFECTPLLAENTV